MEKILAPFLAEPYSKCLGEGKITLVFNGDFKIKYGDMELPVSAKSSEKILFNGSPKQIIERYNHDPKLLGKLLSTQFYVLTHWKTALKQINYRRFFDIITLIGLRMENPEALEEFHRLIFELAKHGKFSDL